MSPSYLLFVLAAFAVFSTVYADLYLQNFRGNNDRLNEESQDRQNDQRLFNSENNARGGYCWGPELTFYAGSIVSLEWTTQHSCGNSNTQCQLVLQYMCTSDSQGSDETLIIRDGLTTNTITTDQDPTSANYYNQKDPNTGAFTYGMNEPISNYLSCAARSRNKGLFLADQPINEGAGAMATRQNNGGTRYGFECTEEHDFYPYWHPSPWKDIAVFADKKSVYTCDYYKSESQNVKAKNYCKGDTTDQKAANNEVDCNKAQGQWAAQPAWGIDAPDCKYAQWSRDNHLGNGVEGHTNSYNWTLPDSGQEDCIKNGNCTCVFRIRYNITVGELTGQEDSKQNGKSVSPVTNDPTVMYMQDNYTLALDTNQVSRTFQDRSYMFRIAPRPDGVSGTIYNLNVRGKRGNIVQTYPATEYDYVPTFLHVTEGDYIHFQWTGCDHNPAGNAGEGRTKTDRTNIVQIKDMSRNYPLNETELQNTPLLFKDAALRRRMANIDQVNCLSYDELLSAQTATGVATDQNPQNCMVLNQAGPRFSGEIVQMNDAGSYAFMNTRNNNFSNRSQKGQITVRPMWKTGYTVAVVVGGTALVGVGAAAGTVFYASRHPLSKVAEAVHRVPGFSKV